MESDPIRNVRRRARKKLTLPEDAACVLCLTREQAIIFNVPVHKLQAAVIAEVNPSNGTFRERIRVVLIEHHLLGIANDPDLTVVMCHNCHEQLHVILRDLGIDFKERPRTIPEAMLSICRCLGAFFALLAETFHRLADKIALFLRTLDERAPKWREWPEAFW